MWYTSSSGRIELNIPLRVAETGYHSGQCDADNERIQSAYGEED